MLVTPCTRDTALSMTAVICAVDAFGRRAGVGGAHGDDRPVDVRQLAHLDALVARRCRR